MNKTALINIIVNELKRIKEIKAIVLGGSNATNTQRPDSDIDFGIFYEAKNPLDIEKVTKAIRNLGVNEKNSIITKIGEWGYWMNGGTWLIVDKQRVDFIYRDLDFVKKTIDESINGKIKTDFYQQPAYGFYSYIYCSEVKESKILYDPSSSILQLKDMVKSYPQKLKTEIINKFMWDAQFSFSRAEKSSERGEIYIVSGCITRIVNDLVQVLYAINETYFFGEKKFYKDINTFNVKPNNFMVRINKILLYEKDRLTSANKLIDEFIILSDGIYKPKYTLNLDEIK